MQIQHHYLISGFNECCQISWRDTHEADELAPGSLVLCSLKFHLTKERFLSLTYMTLLWTPLCVAPVAKGSPVHSAPYTFRVIASLLFFLAASSSPQNQKKTSRDSIRALSPGVSAWLGCHPGLLGVAMQHSPCSHREASRDLSVQSFQASLLHPLTITPPLCWFVVLGGDKGSWCLETHSAAAQDRQGCAAECHNKGSEQKWMRKYFRAISWDHSPVF